VPVEGALVNEEHAALLRRAWAAYDRGDEDGFADCLADDWREHLPGGEVATLADERKTMAAHRVAFPDKHTEILRMVASDDMVACHCTTSAVQRGAYFDLPPTGTRVSVDEMMFNRIVDGKIAETWVITAGPGFYRQLTGREAPEDVDNMG
jgi:predicted ester cyclase